MQIQTFSIERYEINPHVFVRVGNSTPIKSGAMRWREIAIINGTKGDAEKVFARFRNDNRIQHRLRLRDVEP